MAKAEAPDGGGLTDEQIRKALAEGGALVVVRIRMASESLKGTRSWKTEYQADILDTLSGSPKAAGPLWHWGGAVLAPGREYVLDLRGAIIQDRHVAAVPAEGRETFLARHREAVARLQSPQGKP